MKVTYLFFNSADHNLKSMEIDNHPDWLNSKRNTYINFPNNTFKGDTERTSELQEPENKRNTYNFKKNIDGTIEVINDKK